MIPIIPIENQVAINIDAPLAGDMTISGLRNPPPLSLYIHIPWCVRKCPYCDFNSHEAKQEIPEAAYVDALIADLEQATPLVWGRKIRSVFFGGGTPSLFSAEAIDRIMSHVRMLTPLEYGAEITLEANPGTMEAAKFTDFKAAGVNRVSIGIQSFNPEHLERLGRIHDDHEARRAAEIGLSTFESVNLDLMYALPNQSLAQALEDVKTACSFKPPHLSCYHLTLEPNTPFHHSPPPLPDDDASSEMQEAIEAMLAEHGYAHYETSAFAQPGKQCRHNLNYWLFGDYLGIGAGAHGKLSFHDRIIRQARFKHPAAYMQKVAAGEHIERKQAITSDELGFEFMMNALRLTQGFDAALFNQRTGLNLATLEPILKQAMTKGLLENQQGLIKPTLLGQRFLNELLQIFLV